jgi:hypothetical protein
MWLVSRRTVKSAPASRSDDEGFQKDYQTRLKEGLEHGHVVPDFPKLKLSFAVLHPANLWRIRPSVV